MTTWTAKCNDLEARLRAIINENQKLIEHLNGLEKQFNEAQHRIQDLQAQKASNEQEISDLNNTINLLTEQN